MTLPGIDRWLSPLSFYGFGVCINYTEYYKKITTSSMFFLLSLEYYHRAE